MGVEIERKFLVEWLPDNFKRSRHFIIEQGYLATESVGRQVRLRKTNKTASLTFKVGRGTLSGSPSRASKLLLNLVHQRMRESRLLKQGETFKDAYLP